MPSSSVIPSRAATGVANAQALSLRRRRWALFSLVCGFLSAEHRCSLPDETGGWVAASSFDGKLSGTSYTCPECEMRWRKTG